MRASRTSSIMVWITLSMSQKRISRTTSIPSPSVSCFHSMPRQSQSCKKSSYLERSTKIHSTSQTSSWTTSIQSKRNSWRTQRFGWFHASSWSRRRRKTSWSMKERTKEKRETNITYQWVTITSTQSSKGISSFQKLPTKRPCESSIRKTRQSWDSFRKLLSSSRPYSLASQYSSEMWWVTTTRSATSSCPFSQSRFRSSMIFCKEKKWPQSRLRTWWRPFSASSSLWKAAKVETWLKLSSRTR